MSGERKRYPGESDEAYPEIYTTIPPQPKEKKPGQLTEQQLKQYFEEGYVQVDNFFSPDELDPARDAVNGLVDNLANILYKAGKVKELYKDYDYHHRLTMLEKEYPGANIVMHKTGVLPQAFRDVWSNDRLMNVAEQIHGTSDLKGHPVWNLRCKTPNADAATVPWHQDSAYLDNDSYNVMSLTAWIPLLDSNEENGCLQMIHRGHRSGKMARHTGCWRDTWYLMLSEEDMEKTLGVDMKKDLVTCPVPYGGVLFFNNLIPHRSLNNSSPEEIRWSLDLRWQRADKAVAFYGVKDGVLLRSADNPNLKIDWSAHDAAEAKEVDVEPTIFGPWIAKWEIVHENRHTAALRKQQTVDTSKVDIPYLGGWHHGTNPDPNN